MKSNNIAVKITSLTLVACLFIVSGCTSRSPEDTAKQYWKAVLAGDESKAKTLVMNPKEDGLETFIKPKDGSKVEFGETIIKDNTATVETSLTWADDEYDTTFAIQTVLQKTDKEWKIDTAETRRIFVSAVYNSTLDGLQKAFEETATEFRRLGEEIMGSVASELTDATRELQEGAEEAKVEIEKFLQQIDQNLVEEIKKHSSQQPTQ